MKDELMRKNSMQKMTENPSGKRLDYISWDDYFMAVAQLSAQRSKDPSTQVGACIVNENNIILGTGYNGFPRGIPDDELSWLKEGEWINTKKPYVVHAEANAITNASGSIENTRIYVSLAPCNDCAKLIIQSRIKEVIFLSDKHKDKAEFQAGRQMLELAGVKLREYKPTRNTITISLVD